MEHYLETNRRRWNELVGLHHDSPYYDVVAFKAGQLSLQSIELEALPDVSGKHLLHLQCHFGLDTLSWARLGATVTGADFSERAIEQARSLSQELGIPASFICSDIYRLPAILHGTYDIVFTSYGVLCWLPDLKSWADLIAHYLKPGGRFLIVEIHPIVSMLEERENRPEFAYPYFPSSEPIKIVREGSYADPQAEVRQKVSYQWSHSLSDVVRALIAAGLTIESLQEYPYSSYPQFPSIMEPRDDGWWGFKAGYPAIPMTFSLMATREV